MNHLFTYGIRDPIAVLLDRQVQEMDVRSLDSEDGGGDSRL